MRASLESLSPYRVQGSEGFILLDNNESFINLLSKVPLQVMQESVEINRYPVDAVDCLVRAYAEYTGLSSGNILAGNGSDEWISLICQFALDPKDVVLVVEPDFSMYAKNARIMGACVERVSLNDDFSLPIGTLLDDIKVMQPKCLFLSNPNNPTGVLYPKATIQALSEAMKQVGGYFVLDEAYIEFAGESYAQQAIKEPHVILLRTASKALGMAGLRLGFLIANERLIENISRIKPPYNVNQLSAFMGTYLLTQRKLIQESFLQQKEQKDALKAILKELVLDHPGVYVYPSQTNFFLIEMKEAKNLYDFLYSRKVKIRYFGQGRLQNALRISAGTKSEMDQLKILLNEWSLRR